MPGSVQGSRASKWSKLVVQIRAPMYLSTPHLRLSRHGIWYARIVVPAAIRAAHPKLQGEIRLSTGTAQKAHAQAFAQKMCLDFITMFPPMDMDMKPGVDRSLLATMVLDLDPVTGRVKRIETQPHDTEADRAMLRRLVENPAALFGLQHMPAHPAASPAPAPVVVETVVAAQLAQNAQASGAPPGVAAAAAAKRPSSDQDQAAPEHGKPLGAVTAAAPTSAWLSEVIEQWLVIHARNGNLAESTRDDTYAPTMKIFRELVSNDKRMTAAGEIWDVPMGDIQPNDIDRFVEQMWLFPRQQGKRASTCSKEKLASGAPAQRREAAITRFMRIRKFSQWAAKAGHLPPESAARLDAALIGLKHEPKGTDEPQLLAESDSDGYVAFSRQELGLLVESDAFSAYAASRPARYWITLIGLFQGPRIAEASQLRPEDFTVVGDLQCMRITARRRDASGRELDAHGKPIPETRLKTDASRRILPIHPKLIELGLLEFVQQRRADRKTFLFDLKWQSHGGFGHGPSKDFRELSKAVGVWKLREKVFHSFRSALAQQLEEAGLDSQLIDWVLGHEVPTIRQKHYARNDGNINVPLRAVHEALSKTYLDLNIAPWEKVRLARPRHYGRATGQDADMA